MQCARCLIRGHFDGMSRVLRLQVALKLALLLAESDDAPAARTVLQSAVKTADRSRSQRNLQRSGSPSERFCQITASRSQPLDSMAALVEDMSDAEQVLAHLHADILQLLFHVELTIGVQEQQATCDKAVAKGVAKLQLRREQVRSSLRYCVCTMCTTSQCDLCCFIASMREKAAQGFREPCC